MASPILLPRLGNSVESCILVDWKVAVGDTVAEGDVVAEVETDKAVMEVESSVTGTVLALLFDVGDDVEVLAEMALVGEEGEELVLAPDVPNVPDEAGEVADAPIEESVAPPVEAPQVDPSASARAAGIASPRARHLAERKGLDVASLAGSGPGGRIIERDVEAALANRPKLSPVAEAKLAAGDFRIPEQGSGPSGRIMAKDLVEQSPPPSGLDHAAVATEDKALAGAALLEEEVEKVPIKGIRKVIAQRMLESIQTTAQLTLNTSADARALQALRARLKASPSELNLQRVTINDLMLFAVARSLPEHPDLNALFTGDTIERHGAVHLGIAVDTPRGLIVPVLRHADQLSLGELSASAKRLVDACLDRTISADELSGGTFTVTNLGALGIESFTPVLNLPQVAILGVGSIELKAVQHGDAENGVAFVPHIGLSLTINHQVVDGAPAAHFLQTLRRNLANIDLLLAV